MVRWKWRVSTLDKMQMNLFPLLSLTTSFALNNDVDVDIDPIFEEEDDQIDATATIMATY